MKKSLAYTIALTGILFAPDVSTAAPGIDYPGPGYRRQLELLYPKCAQDDVLKVRVAPVIEIKPASDFWPVQAPVDLSQPIRLFPQSLPAITAPLPPSSKTLK